MEQHFKILKPVTFNIKNLASLCLTVDEVVQGAGKRASAVQLMGAFALVTGYSPFGFHTIKGSLSQVPIPPPAIKNTIHTN